MTEEEAYAKLKALEFNDDPEMAHIKADDILCELLLSLGCKRVVDEFGKLTKWYA